MLSALSRCIRCTPSLSLLFHSFSFWLTDQLTDSSDSTTGDDDCDDDDGDGAAPCGARRVGPCALAAAAAARVCDDSGRGRTQKEGCRRCVCVCRCHATTSQQTCCDSVTLTSLWSSRKAEARPTSMHLVDGVRHLSRRCREQDVLALHDVHGVSRWHSRLWLVDYLLLGGNRERERELLVSLLPLVACHADYCLSADHGWHASTSDVVCGHFTAPVKHTSRRMLWLWMWCRECSRHYFARLPFTALRQIDASPPESFTAAPCVVLPAQDSPVV
ncbi:hypothetical protein TcYC6_0078530 [Trypanosoma cruzi]|nr:hypothetical protein TcYC6_0078510 [Trypanosoma cruzi]KAF8297546.1 hypothetical protein TcYC6_0078530 [Trypanosoma cruzi]